MNNHNITEIYKTLNILCVEDDEDVLEIYKNLFSLIFKKVYFATNGIEGFERFEQEDVDIILTDYMMPKCNGLQMSKKIRAVDESIPIVMVTALESIEMLRDAIDLQITSFLKKPFTSSSLFSTFNLAVKSVVVDRCIFREQKEKILYSDYQENLTFTKEKIITKNDISTSKKFFDFHCEVFYKPKDTLSGDSYVIRKINEDEYFMFLVDGMGKGISASISAMLCSSFVNYYINQQLEEQNSFSLTTILEELLKFIAPNLLEYEVISANFLYFNKKREELQYAMFSMPPILYMFNSNDVCKLQSNNTPLAAYSTQFIVNTLDISKLSKMLIYSDGLNENSLKNSQKSYTLHIKDDFKMAKDIQELQNLYEEKIAMQEDDITYILMSRD